jgi:hypothetical protein
VSYLDQRFGPQGRVIAGDVGRLAYGFRGAVDDLFGLNSYAFTLRFQGDIAAYGAYLLERRPDAILLCRDDRSGRFCHHAEAVLAGLPDFARHYREVRSFGRRRIPGAHFVIYEGVEKTSLLR